MEDPNLHFSIFLEVCDTLKLNGVSSDVIRLRLFPFSLKDKAQAWLHSLPPDSIRTWDELTRVFLAKFFPLSKTTSFKNQITTFTQREDESLYEVWEQFKGLLRLYPHHALQKWMIIQTFYNGVIQPVQSTINVGAGGTLMNKTEDEAYNLIEERTLNNFQWSTERGQPNQIRGRLEVDTLTLLSAKVNAMTQRLDCMDVNAVNSSVSPPCEICGSVDHLTLNFQVGSPFVQDTNEVNYVNNFNPRPTNDPYSNTYNPG